ncbi:hypothetical protein TorRG33x02_291770 [Trema orientale]|uniref:Uncharacterized protein n=1 Tax=Trema orientale TaxID=63057 RepID=A0A2P5CAV1_TREOI|nr:hypothetical protein TorRG33x02_291770 [Trema orientale]
MGGIPGIEGAIEGSSKNSSNVSSQSRPENCSTELVDFDNNEARVCESVSLPYGSEKKVPNSEVYSIPKDDVFTTIRHKFASESMYIGKATAVQVQCGYGKNSPAGSGGHNLLSNSNKFNSDDHCARVVVNLVTSSQNLNEDKLCSDARNYYRTRFATGSFGIGSQVFQSKYKKAKVEG